MASINSITKRKDKLENNIIGDCDSLFNITELPSEVIRESLIRVSVHANELIKGMDMDIREEANER